MEKFASTDAFLGLLEDGKYKRLVMENDDNAFGTEADLDSVVNKYKSRTSRPTNYDYFTERKIKE
jgi:hypothetical protein